MASIEGTTAALSRLAQCGTAAAGRLFEATWRATGEGFNETLNVTRQLGKVRNPMDALGVGVMGLESAGRVSARYAREIVATGARFIADVGAATAAPDRNSNADRAQEQEPAAVREADQGPQADVDAQANVDAQARGNGSETASRSGPLRDEAALQVQERDATTHIDPAEVVIWAQRLSVSREELRTAISRVGPVLSDVKRFLTGDPRPVRKAPGHREERPDDIRAAAELEEGRAAG
ncbi:MAG TPA: DUF3606 domain-containing protein [Burkholderiales bacterium]|nr:DUF3606 domain-containing protein [Burkholderiales bacterium]